MRAKKRGRDNGGETEGENQIEKKGVGSLGVRGRAAGGERGKPLTESRVHTTEIGKK